MQDTPPSPPTPDPGDCYHDRFSGIARLYGSQALARFRAAHLAVIGIGGVGSWAAEALARSGIGRLTLVDLDDLCLTNVNRQIHALDGHLGRPKVDAMADRLRAINPHGRVHPRQMFFHRQSADEILGAGIDGVIDAIDAIAPKSLLLARCRREAIPVVTCGAAGGRRDPTAIVVDDLSRTHHDALLLLVRRELRRNHGFPKGEPPEHLGIPAVFSPEEALYPQPDGSVSPRRPSGGLPSGSRCDAGFGTATHITATFGLFATASLLQTLAEG